MGNDGALLTIEQIDKRLAEFDADYVNIAHSIGLLENYITSKDPLIEISSFVNKRTLHLELLRCGIHLYELFIMPFEFSTVEEAHCCALGTAIVWVLQVRK